jgi:RNA polymerase sigma-70 factor (ECF subfamily)
MDGELGELNTSGASDEHFVRQALGGDVGAFDVLIDRYKHRLFVYIYNMIGHKEDTDDVLMDTFIKAYQNLHRFKGNSAFSTWLYRIAHNRALDFLRAQKTRKKVIDEGRGLDDCGNGEDELGVVNQSEDRSVAGNVSREVVNKELENKLNESLNKLSNNHRAVVIMYDIQGKSHAEIAQIMGCSEGTVRSRLHYAHLELQNYLKEFVK